MYKACLSDAFCAVLFGLIIWPIMEHIDASHDTTMAKMCICLKSMVLMGSAARLICLVCIVVCCYMTELSSNKQNVRRSHMVIRRADETACHICHIDLVSFVLPNFEVYRALEILCSEQPGNGMPETSIYANNSY